MSKLVYDKKQLPQVIVLGLLSAVLFGYFTYRMVVPPPSEALPAAPAKTAAAAAPSPAPGAPVQVASAPPGAVIATADPSAVPVIDSPPAPGIHDPFIPPAITVDPSEVRPGDTANGLPPSVKPLPAPTRIAKMPSFTPIAPLPSAPPLPPGGLSGFKSVTASPLPSPTKPVADPGPAGWVVTGVLGADDNPGGRIACLRNGDIHRFVRAGASIDGDFQVVSINRDSVVLRKAERVYRLMLGTSIQPANSSTPSAPAGSTLSLPAAADKTVPAVILRKRGLVGASA